MYGNVWGGAGFGHVHVRARGRPFWFWVAILLVLVYWVWSRLFRGGPARGRFCFSTVWVVSCPASAGLFGFWSFCCWRKLFRFRCAILTLADVTIAFGIVVRPRILLERAAAMVGVGRTAVVGAGWGNPDLLPRPKKVFSLSLYMYMYHFVDDLVYYKCTWYGTYM